MPNVKVKEIKCPKCERVWPTVSEQGIVTELQGECYACFIAKVIIARDERAEEADYTVENCGYCGGLEPAREKCTSCFARGWEGISKKKSVIELAH